MSEQLSTDLVIEAVDMVKRYNEDVMAVDGVKLSIPGKTIYALLGPNGAGKTTTPFPQQRSVSPIYVAHVDANWLADQPHHVHGQRSAPDGPGVW